LNDGRGIAPANRIVIETLRSRTLPFGAPFGRFGGYAMTFHPVLPRILPRFVDPAPSAVFRAPDLFVERPLRTFRLKRTEGESLH
jgi:hypothetical protein